MTLEMSSWKWIECPNGHIGQRANPSLLEKGAKPFCPVCDQEMLFKECPR
jgi:hypothetical protein